MVESDKVHWLTRKPPQKVCNGHMVVYLFFANRSAERLWSKYCWGNVLFIPSFMFISNKSKKRRCCTDCFFCRHSSRLWHIIGPPAAFFDVKVPHWRTEIADFRGVLFAYEWVRLVVHPCRQCMIVMGSRFFGNVQRFWIQGIVTWIQLLRILWCYIHESDATGWDDWEGTWVGKQDTTWCQGSVGSAVCLSAWQGRLLIILGYGRQHKYANIGKGSIDDYWQYYWCIISL